MTEELSPEELEVGRHLFAQECGFVWGAARLDQLPEATMPEIAFAGRSNVGKSSLVNALTGRKTLARTSNTPGRTQQLNFFNLGNRLMIVDLPGYGYAKVSKTTVEAWNRTLRQFLKGRTVLQRVLLLVDSRHGLKDTDREMMDMLDQAAVSYQVILTKVDKPKKPELDAIVAETEAELRKHVAAHPVIVCTSADKGTGIPELRAGLAALAD